MKSEMERDHIVHASASALRRRQSTAFVQSGTIQGDK